MSGIASMYEDLKAKSGSDKVASDETTNTETEFAYEANEVQDLVMDADYFNKLASGDEGVQEHFGGVIKEASEAGYSEEQIDDSIAELAAEAGVNLDELLAGYDAGGESVEQGGNFEMAKQASYVEGANEAIEHVFNENELIKEGHVTGDDLEEYYLGMAYGAGYYEKRAELEEAIEKIAAAKKKDSLKKKMGYGAAGAGGAAAVAAGGAAAHRQGMIPGTNRSAGRALLKGESAGRFARMKAGDVAKRITALAK